MYCEGVGGTGSAFMKGYNNANCNNCYNFVVNTNNETILKASGE